MPLPVYRLRRWLAATAVLFTVVVAGMYFYARLRQRSVLKLVPGKIGYDIKQTATGFQFSKSDGGRTLFTIQASDLKEFKLNGRAELHHVTILLYGRDSSRFDQIYGDDFTYDQRSGDVMAKGDVQIDLEANPAGLTGPDQGTPKELKNPIHLKTRDLVFNRESGNASTAARVEFSTPQISGWAVGVQYAARTNTLTLASQIHVSTSGHDALDIQAARGVITNEPREVVLEHPHLERSGGALQADRATFYLTEDDTVDRVLAEGNVTADKQFDASKSRRQSGKHSKSASSSAPGKAATAAPPQISQVRARANQVELLLTGKQPQLHTATLTGDVQLERTGFQPMRGRAGRVVLDFAGQNQVRQVHAFDGVNLAESSPTNAPPNVTKADTSGPQNFAITAPAMDFFVAGGRRLYRAVTSGAAQIVIFPAQNSSLAANSAPPPQRTEIRAGRFDAKFEQTAEGRNRLATVIGSPDARIVNFNPGHADRTSTSETVRAVFLPQGGIDSVVQQGNVVYSDGESREKQTQAWSDTARYTPSDQVLTFLGSPRVVTGGMATTAKTIRINRKTGEAVAEGDVKSTYSELKEQPNGALLASSSPIHVTARSMTAHNNPGVALYSGNVRLWQDANIIQAPSIQFDRERRAVTAQGTPAQPVSTILIQPSKTEASKSLKAPKKAGQTDNSGPIAITGNRLTYSDADRKAHYEGGVNAKGADFTAFAKTMDVFLLPRIETISSQPLAGSGQVDRMVAQGDIVVQQENRRAEGQTLVYTAAEDKFLLTGGPPCIFDAERGKITGVSLTFYRHDARVLVEGEASSPVVTQTRVAR
jgi:lipopolysaccharide export system protein LptA